MLDMSYLEEKPIAVLGGGATGRGHAACAAIVGKEVRLYEHPDFFEGLGCIRETRQIELSGLQQSLYGFKRKGIATLTMVTDDMENAVKGAGLIVVSLPAVGFKPFFERLIPYLEDGQVIHFTTANFGSMILRKMMREAACHKRVIIGEWASQPYGIRIQSSGGQQLPELRINYWAITLRGAAFPMADQEAFFESKKYLPSLDSVVDPIEADTVLDACFSNVNPILHCPGTILGVGAMENWGLIYGEDKYTFSIYSHAYCPSISKVQLALYKEECALAKALGVGIQHYDNETFFSRSTILGAEHMGPKYKIPFEEQYQSAWTTGPFSIYNRYITEDIPVGCHLFHLMGKKYGIETPIIDSMIHLANVMTESNYFETGFTLEDIGLENLSPEQIQKYLREGKF